MGPRALTRLGEQPSHPGAKTSTQTPADVAAELHALMGWPCVDGCLPHPPQAVVPGGTVADAQAKVLNRLGNPPMYEKPLRKIPMVSRIRRTLTVQQRAEAFERTNKAAAEAAEEERRRREEKNERLRRLRVACES